VAASNAPSHVSTWRLEMSAACRRRCRIMLEALAGPVLESLTSRSLHTLRMATIMPGLRVLLLFEGHSRIMTGSALKSLSST
jgi:hypothetical protein